MSVSLKAGTKKIDPLSFETPWASDDDDRMRAMAAEGSSLHRIGNRLNRAMAAVRQRASQLAIRIPMIVEAEQSAMRFDFIAEPNGRLQVMVWAKEAVHAYAQAMRLFTAQAMLTGVSPPSDVRLVSISIEHDGSHAPA